MFEARIRGVGAYLPHRRMPNTDWSAYVETSDEWIVTRTGIEARHIADDTETASAMGALAAREALSMAECPVEEVDGIVVATSTPDKRFPSTACLIQQKLQIQRAFAFDVVAACNGFITALITAWHAIRTGACRHCLVIGSEQMSRTVDWSDRRICVLFGDGAGAVLLSRSTGPGILQGALYSDPTQAEILHLPHKDFTSPGFMAMEGREVFRHAVSNMESTIQYLLEQEGLNANQLDWLIPHQANIRILHAIAERLSFPKEKVIQTVSQHGNTSAASIPLALHSAVRSGQIRQGERVILTAFGGGLTWGGVLLRY